MASNSEQPKSAAQQADPPTADPTSSPTKVWKSEDLLNGQAEVTILHNDQVYRLRCTRQGKLILYK